MGYLLFAWNIFGSISKYIVSSHTKRGANRPSLSFFVPPTGLMGLVLRITPGSQWSNGIFRFSKCLSVNYQDRIDDNSDELLVKEKEVVDLEKRIKKRRGYFGKLLKWWNPYIKWVHGCAKCECAGSQVMCR